MLHLLKEETEVTYFSFPAATVAVTITSTLYL